MTYHDDDNINSRLVLAVRSRQPVLFLLLLVCLQMVLQQWTVCPEPGQPDSTSQPDIPWEAEAAELLILVGFINPEGLLPTALVSAELGLDKKDVDSRYGCCAFLVKPSTATTRENRHCQRLLLA
jgi:hypothetical protein